MAVDPAVTSNPRSNETGIIVGGLSSDGHAYIWADYSLRDTPDVWAKRVTKAYKDNDADRIIVETNNGGELVASNLRTQDSLLPITEVHASRGKITRAEPVSALHEQGFIHFVGVLPELEEQLTRFVAGEKPETGAENDRADAFVWLMHWLMPSMSRNILKLDSYIPDLPGSIPPVFQRAFDRKF